MSVALTGNIGLNISNEKHKSDKPSFWCFGRRMRYNAINVAYTIYGKSKRHLLKFQFSVTDV